MSRVVEIYLKLLMVYAVAAFYQFGVDIIIAIPLFLAWNFVVPGVLALGTITYFQMLAAVFGIHLFLGSKVTLNE